MAVPSERVVLQKIEPSHIEAFLEHLRRSGRPSGTLEKYQRDLTLFYDFLPESKELDEAVLAQWPATMLEEGYALRTVNSRISVLNSFLRHVGRRDLQLAILERPEDGGQPELTRAEYLRFLSTARALNKERLYLLIKVFGSTGLPLQGLPGLTVEAVNRQTVTVGPNTFFIPDCLRQELLDYARRNGILSGPVFLMQNGQPLRRTQVTDGIRALSSEARVPPEKASPRCLQRLYRSTQAELHEQISQLVRQTYDHLLETEQLAIGWNETDG